MKRIFLTTIACACALGSTMAWSSVNIVAAENFYGDMAQTLGGSSVNVVSILSNPNQDPHDFTVSPRVAETLQSADIVIENGLGYDSWMDQLGQASSHKAVFINVGKLMGYQLGDNPHVWYSPQMPLVFASELLKILIQQDPANSQEYQRRFDDFKSKVVAYQAEVAQVKKEVKGRVVTATEPVAGYLVEALGLKMVNQSFQWTVMNGGEPTPSQMMGFEKSLTQKTVAILLVNSQVSDPSTDRFKTLAKALSIPIIGVTETLPRDKHYLDWMETTLAQLAFGLGVAS